MDNTTNSDDHDHKDVDVINFYHDVDLSKNEKFMNTKPLQECSAYPFSRDKEEDLSQTSVFLQTLNLKSKTMSDQYNVSKTEDTGRGNDEIAEHTSVKCDIDLSDQHNPYMCMNNNAVRIGESEQDQRYPNFLTEDMRTSEDNFKSESDTFNDSETQNSLGKTLATSLHLIASTDAHTLLPHVETPLPDSGGLDELQPATMEPSGPCSNDSVTSTTHEAEYSPPPTRYRTRSIAVSEKNTPVKEEPQLKNHSNLEQKEEGISSTENEPFYPCDQCGKIFHKKQTLRQHFITHTDRFACNFCRVRCKSKGDLRSHTQTHTKEKPFHCEVCNTYYTRESILKKHKTTQLHKSECLKLERKRCYSRQEKKSSSNQSTRAQRQNMIKKTKLACNKCTKVFLSRITLRKHIKIHRFSFPCSKCHKRCKTAELLRIHERCHTKSTTLLCKFCSRAFLSKHVLKEHIKIHYRMNDTHLRIPVREPLTQSAPESNTAEDFKISKPRQGRKSKKQQEIMVCQTCSRQFKSPKAFEKHCAKHVNSSPDKASKEDTGKDKIEDRSLSTEGRDEVEVRKCTECEMTFNTFENLKAHRTDAHQMETMVCNICYRIFGDSTEYKSHVQNHAPTMLFSGEFLEKSKMNMSYKKISKRNINSKVGEPDNSSLEMKAVACNTKTLNSVRNQSKEESSGESFLNCSEFIRLLRNALSESSDEEVSDDEEFEDLQLYRGLQNLFYLNMIGSVGENETSVCTTPRLNQKDQSSPDPKSNFDTHVIQDYENHIYKCIPCNAFFTENDALIEHMKTHTCEICKEFFVEEKMLLEHKYKNDHNHAKGESREKLFDFTSDIRPDDDSSTSEDEANDLFLDELESILDCETKLLPQIDLLHTFNHDEIVKSNKKIFERYSCVDVPTNIYACTICKRKYARPTTLTRHFKTHVCHYCNKFFIDKSDLVEHKYKHRQKAALLKAEISGEPSTKLLNSPIVSKTNRELFKKFTFIDSSRNLNKCCLCDKTFVRKTVLTRHMKTHICSYCDKFYEDKYELARHVSLHKIDARVSEDGGDAREFNDFDDEKPYTNRSTLRDQLDNDGKVVTLGPTFPTSLPHFSSTFNNPGENGHETLTFIEIPVSDACENTSNVAFGDTNEAVTSTYQIISDSIDAFKESAHESFIVDGSGCQADDSNKIITISQGQIMAADGNQDRLNLFECTLCGKTFFKSGHLKSHMSTHTVRKPHVCDLCGKSFVRRGALKRHEKNHDIKRCKYCDTSFTYQFELDDHMQMHESYPFYK